MPRGVRRFRRSPATASGIAPRVREEKLLAVDLVTRDHRLPARRDEPVDELLAEVLLDVRMFFRIDEHHAVLVEQALVALDHDLEIATVLEREPCSPVGEDV